MLVHTDVQICLVHILRLQWFRFTSVWFTFRVTFLWLIFFRFILVEVSFRFTFVYSYLDSHLLYSIHIHLIHICLNMNLDSCSFDTHLNSSSFDSCVDSLYDWPLFDSPWDSCFFLNIKFTIIWFSLILLSCRWRKNHLIHLCFQFDSLICWFTLRSTFCEFPFVWTWI